MAKVVHYILSSSDSETETEIKPLSPPKSSSYPILLCPTTISYAVGLDPQSQKLPWLQQSSDVIDLHRRVNKSQVYTGDASKVADQRRQPMNIDSSCIEVSGKDFENLPSKRTRGRIFAPSSKELNDISSFDVLNDPIPVLVDKNMDENIDSGCIEVSGKDFSKLPSKRTRRRVFAPVSVPVPAARIPDLVSENRVDENVDLNCVEVSSKDFSKIPSKRTRRRLFAPVSVPPTLSNAARFSGQNSVGYGSAEIHGNRDTSVGENVGDCNVNVKDGLGLRVDGDVIMGEHEGNGIQHPTLVTEEPPVNSWDTSLNRADEKVHMESQLGKRGGGGVLFRDENVKWIISSSSTNKDFASAPTASVNDSAHHSGTKEKQTKWDGAMILYDKYVNRIISPSPLKKEFAGTPTASVNDSAHHPGTEEKQTKRDGAMILYDKNVNRIISASPLKKEFSGTPAASVNDSAHHPAIGENHTEHDKRVVFQAAVEDLSQPKAEANFPDGLLTVPLLKHQKIALAWMVHRETTKLPCLGGILADDQGLGKTVSMIALIQYQRYIKSQSKTGDKSDHGIGESNDQHMFPNYADRFYIKRPEAGTLIVCPTSILCQWAQELDDKVADGAKLSVLVYHGSNRTKDHVKLAKYDVVLTTYAVVANAFPKQEDEIGDEVDGKKKNDIYSIGCTSDPLAKVYWLRVILDEAQCIKNHRTRSATSCCGLRANSRWCLSGTPLQNKLDDLYSYFRFLKYHPYSYYSKFSSSLKSVSRTGCYKKLQVVLKTILLRRTKDTLIDGKPIVTLPTKSISLMKVELSTEERSFYSQLEARSSSQFEEYDRAGTINRNYANILVLLLYLRMACDHPYLVDKPPHKPVDKTSLEMARKLPRDTLCKFFNLLEDSSAVCGKCKDTPEDAVVTTCGHVFCHQCVAEHLVGARNLCPEFDCKVHLRSDLVYSKATISRFFPSEPTNKATSSSKVIENSAVLQRSYKSSKIKAALEILKSNSKSSLSSGDGSVATPVKTIVFSQWTCMLDLMEISLDESGIKFKRFDGTMTLALRDKAVKDFVSNPEVNVILMSLKAGNLGLNLVAACHVILLDPWWNPTTEDQAIDRAHRLGQTRPVTVSRLAVSETVEDRIFKLQEEKRELVASVFGDGKFGGSAARLTVDDLRFLFGFRV
ncbi:hypothetical protein C5167_025729 [Papaver somniferum]|uniref:Helicase-like transcription factor CHR28 n=1 Tax=Papaver somniferum TaxID=3469 RepID=A0A4Y7JW97_PAPSO|nr:hypothetical protein C5167_025729 [Papaver somniferum]